MNKKATDKNVEVKRVFISHVADADKDRASALQDWIPLAYKKRHHVDVFVSSTDGIEAGKDPIQTIKQNLWKSDVLIVVLTKNAARNKWVLFESGFVAARKKPIIPFLCKGASVNDISGPLKEMFQIKDTNECDQFTQAISTLSDAIGEPPGKEYETLRATLSKPDPAQHNDNTENANHQAECSNENAISANYRLFLRPYNGFGFQIDDRWGEVICPKCNIKGTETFMVLNGMGQDAVFHCHGCGNNFPLYCRSSQQPTKGSNQ